MTPFEAKGWTKDDTFRVLTPIPNYNKDALFTLDTDDGSTILKFRHSVSKTGHICISNLVKVIRNNGQPIVVGSKVTISKSSRYYASTSAHTNPAETIGDVISVDMGADTSLLGISVKWPGSKNSYSCKDLDLVSDAILTPDTPVFKKGEYAKCLVSTYTNISLNGVYKIDKVRTAQSGVWLELFDSNSATTNVYPILEHFAPCNAAGDVVYHEQDVCTVDGDDELATGDLAEVVKVDLKWVGLARLRDYIKCGQQVRIIKILSMSRCQFEFVNDIFGDSELLCAHKCLCPIAWLKKIDSTGGSQVLDEIVSQVFKLTGLEKDHHKSQEDHIMTHRKIVNVSLVDNDAALDVSLSVVAVFHDLVTEDGDEVLIREILINPGLDVAGKITEHNAKRVNETDLAVLKATGNKVTLQPIRLKDLTWSIK